MRDLVTGAASCADPASSSASNPLGALANALIGSSSKTQVQLRSLCCRFVLSDSDNLSEMILFCVVFSFLLGARAHGRKWLRSVTTGF